MKIKHSLLPVLLAIAAAPSALVAADIVVTASVTANTTWTRNNVYLLDTKIFVESVLIDVVSTSPLLIELTVVSTPSGAVMSGLALTSGAAIAF